MNIGYGLKAKKYANDIENGYRIDFNVIVGYQLKNFITQ